MRGIAAAACLIGFSLGGLAIGQETDHSASLLLTPNLLRRLQRDRQRQTVRWQNFETRVQTVHNSSERGFELALYYAVTSDEQRGQEAVDWALTHRCQPRQVALVLDWVRPMMSSAQREMLKTAPCDSADSGVHPSAIIMLRDSLFRMISSGDLDPNRLTSANKRLLSTIENAPTVDPEDVYAAVEYLMAIRNVTRNDLRQRDPLFFSQLPKEFLLSLNPRQVETPEWMAHIAALALVTLDPNLENSQFLQGWAMEERQMLRSGPGVAYEFMWADPYLPGIAYQNMDPWTYSATGRLFARADWSPSACWIAITPSQFNQENCPAALSDNSTFGTLTLLKLTQCLTIPPRKNNQTDMLWKLIPHAELTYEHDGKRSPNQADAAGMWPVPNDTSGKICLSKFNRR